MYRVSIELQKHEWKFGRTKNAVGTRAAGECFHSFFEFSRTFTSVSITRQEHGVHVFYFFQKTPQREKGKQFVKFDYQNVNSLCSRHHYVNSARQFCVSIEIELFLKTLSKEKQSSHKPRPQGSMGSFKSVFIAAVNRELKGNLSTDDGDARDDAQQNMDLNFTLKFREYLNPFRAHICLKTC